MTAGSIPEVQIEQTMILLRSFGEIMGLSPAVLEKVLDKARADLFAGQDKRPEPGPPE